MTIVPNLTWVDKKTRQRHISRGKWLDLIVRVLIMILERVLENM